MNDKGKAVGALVAVGVHHARLQFQGRDDVEVVVLHQILGVLASGGYHDGIEQIGPHRMPVQDRRAIDDHSNPLVTQGSHPCLVHIGGNDGLARQLFDLEGIQQMNGGHYHAGFLQSLAHYVARPLFHRPLVQRRG